VRCLNKDNLSIRRVVEYKQPVEEKKKYSLTQRCGLSSNELTSLKVKRQLTWWWLYASNSESPYDFDKQISVHIHLSFNFQFELYIIG
jgi:hypothetical protein